VLNWGATKDSCDEVLVDQFANDPKMDEYPLQVLVVGIVTSYPFIHRRLNRPGDAFHAK
jgi:hypothetical protein